MPTAKLKSKEDFCNDALDNLRTVLTGTNPRAKTTVKDYMEKARAFLEWLPQPREPVAMDYHRYFSHRRQGGMASSSLSTIFAILKALALANGWQFPLTRYDRPPRRGERQTPGFTLAEIRTLIEHQAEYTRRQRYFLALATLVAPRREELCRVEDEDLKGTTLLLHTAKKGREHLHLIPDVLLPILRAYKPKRHSASGLSMMFQRICLKAFGEKRPGYGWHSFRRSLRTMLPTRLAREGYDISLTGRYLRWSPQYTGAMFFDTPTVGFYDRPELLEGGLEGGLGEERLVLNVHPFLPIWIEVLAKACEETLLEEREAIGSELTTPEERKATEQE